MIKRVFIKYEIPAGQSWLDGLASVNLQWSDWNQKYNSPNPVEEYDQKLEWYRRLFADYRMQMQFFRSYGDTPETFLSLGFPLDIPNQAVTIASIKMDMIIELLDSGKYRDIFFAFYFGNNPDGAGDFDVLKKSNYYGRNLETGVFENVETGEAITEAAPKFSLFYCVSKIGISNIYYMTTNPELTSVLRDLDGNFNGVEYRLMDGHDGTFANAVFQPTVRSGGILADSNIIVATEDRVVIDVFGKSAVNNFGVKPIPDSELPRIDLLVESESPVTINNHLVEVDIGDSRVEYVKVRWITNSPLDYQFISAAESPTRSYVIIRR